ncbi:Dual-specificity RNA methyltransferase RlmN [uncultured Alphaproteobacteria bacterium]|uniref:Dual-specificity RNA methyltransferase RlmN n=1 Tax=uncultured Alphaproteobacteria bacterium TaxID=91750 RepID=A0A212K5K5_9PROT|nr:Dual-specificity RNA methyltransferase RlmN [uncultured Alphaproteobacteria bacterium]
MHAQPATPASPDGDARIDLVGLSREELTAVLVDMGEKPFRTKQLWHWIYHQGETDFMKMTSLATPLRERLAERCVIGRPRIVTEQNSADGTRKWLFAMPDGNQVETVHIPEDDRGAVCVSTQVGCTMTCRFCHTGTQMLVRNLTAAEIVGQFMAARDSYGEWPTPTDETRHLSNVVLMGMGEPLMNYEAMAKAMKIVMDPEGIAMSKRRVTLSTSGYIPNMRRCAEELGIKLAVSFHAPTDEVRERIMPINRKYPIAELMAAMKDYQEIAGQRQYVTIEYILLKGVNDALADARELVRLFDASGIGVKFNLIPFNPWPGAPFETPSIKTCQAFAEVLTAAGYAAPIRVPRGRDILAACGQLKSASERQRLSRARAREAAGIVDPAHAEIS